MLLELCLYQYQQFIRAREAVQSSSRVYRTTELCSPSDYMETNSLLACDDTKKKNKPVELFSLDHPSLVCSSSKPLNTFHMFNVQATMNILIELLT